MFTLAKKQVDEVADEIETRASIGREVLKNQLEDPDTVQQRYVFRSRRVKISSCAFDAYSIFMTVTVRSKIKP